MSNSILRRSTSSPKKEAIIAVAVSLTAVAIVVGVAWMLIRKKSRTGRGHSDDAERYPVHHHAGISEHKPMINGNGILAPRMSEIINRPPPAALTGNPRRCEFRPNEMTPMRRHTTQRQGPNYNYRNNRRRYSDGDNRHSRRASNATSEEYGTGCCDGLIGDQHHGHEYPTRSQSERHPKAKFLEPRVHNQRVDSNGSQNQHRRNPSSQSRTSTRSRSHHISTVVHSHPIPDYITRNPDPWYVNSGSGILYPDPPYAAAALAQVRIPSTVLQSPTSSNASNSPSWSPIVSPTSQERHTIAPFTDYEVGQPDDEISPWTRTETPTESPPISPISPISPTYPGQVPDSPPFDLSRNTYEFIPDIHPGTLVTYDNLRRQIETPPMSSPSTIYYEAESSPTTPQHWWMVLSSGNISQRIRRGSTNSAREFRRLLRGSRLGSQSAQSQQTQIQSQQSSKSSQNQHGQSVRSWRQGLQNLQIPLDSGNRRQSEQPPLTQPMQPPQLHERRRQTVCALTIATGQPHLPRREAEPQTEPEIKSESESERQENEEEPIINSPEPVYSPSIYSEEGASGPSSLSLDEVLTSIAITPTTENKEEPSNASSPTLGYESAITVSSTFYGIGSAAGSATRINITPRSSRVSVAAVSSDDESTATKKAASNISAISTESLVTEARISLALRRQEENCLLKAVLQPKMPSNISIESLYLPQSVVSPASSSTPATSKSEEAIRTDSSTNKLNQKASLSSLTSVTSRTSRFREEDVDIDTTPCAPRPTPAPRTVRKTSSSSLASLVSRASRASFTSWHVSRSSPASRRTSQISLTSDSASHTSLPPVPYPTPAPGLPGSTPIERKLLKTVSTEQLHLRAANIRAKLNQSPGGPLAGPQSAIPGPAKKAVTKRRWEAVGGKWMRRTRIVTPRGTLE
ncbi:hypothetical protein FPQ18DRAFT_393084 [Pyronema domesticum]|nr:hypothetical protein FPQ18DRAFT_393084 [Pyronema domesticum]